MDVFLSIICKNNYISIGHAFIMILRNIFSVQYSVDTYNNKNTSKLTHCNIEYNTKNAQLII